MQLPLRFFPLALLGLSACAQLQQTGSALLNYNGVLLDHEEQQVGRQRFRVLIRGSAVMFENDIEQFFKRRAQDYSQELGCRGYKLVQYRAGLENTLLGARRYADGVIECVT
ncbi:hypothetical protein [Parachitinimonas caeni]|uniref:Lipoprotein n=1 Tax=Parachitinimonas caeni TaxID=3031301 RepID=A0ABT7DTP1_9NEIS|nr:hypothetical protein [Parachitinimonas caeni]MDK2122453.1 hypothetical protein [Parachitinimonas caeni]